MVRDEAEGDIHKTLVGVHEKEIFVRLVAKQTINLICKNTL